MTLFISNPSRGGADPSAAGDPTGAKVTDPIQVSVRDTDEPVDISSIQFSVGYARAHALGVNGPFDAQLPRTKRASLLSPVAYSMNPTIGVVGSGLVITKGSDIPEASTYFTSIDRGSNPNYGAMFTAVISVASSPVYTNGDLDPLGPVIGLEHGPRKTAAYCFFVDNGVAKQVRICGPSVGGTRSPDIYVPYDWSIITDQQYILFWNEAKGVLELWTDNTTGTGGIGTATLVASVELVNFQQFGPVGSVPAGGANDITGIYGVEGKSSAEISIISAATSSDAGYPFVNGARGGGWKTYLDPDYEIGFSGAVDPTHLTRGGIWFKNPASADSAGQIIPSAGGYCRLLKNTASTDFSIYRDEPGFAKTTTDGFLIEFKCHSSTTGGTGFATGAAIQISDGQTLFQLDFLFDGSTRTVGILLLGGDPTVPANHLAPTTPVDYSTKTLRLTVDSRRNLIELFDTADLDTPLGSWALNRAALPTATTSQIVVGLPVTSTPAVGALDIYSLRYSYIYQAWEARDSLTPLSANPPFSSGTPAGGGGPLSAAVMPGVLPLPYFIDSGGGGGGGAGSGSGSLTSEGYRITTAGGETYYFSRGAPFNSEIGAIMEFRMKIESWHPFERTSVFAFIDDGNNAFMLSFVETNEGKFVCVPLSANVSGFQEYAGTTGQGALLSVAIDWTVSHTYRLERRPRDGLYLFIDNNAVPALVLLDLAQYSFPATQLSAKDIAFGQLTDEGAVSVWEFVRGQFGSGFEISTILNLPQSELQSRLSGARTTVVVTVGE